MAPSTTRQSLSRLKLDRKGRHKVGKKLGEGAQGAVYEVVRTDTGESGQWAVKLTPHPKPTRSRRSEDEINARHLSYERQLYQCSLLQLQGTVIPRVPESEKNLQVYGQDADGKSSDPQCRVRASETHNDALLLLLAGWNFLVIERMEQDLFSALGSLPSLRNSVDLGPLALKLLDMFRQFHENGFVVVDVKPENLMIAPKASLNSKESIVDRVRMVDLGLFTTFRSVAGGSGHVPNDTSSQVQGTPLYASLNMHELNKASRRDDIESLLYLLGEFVICVHAGQTGKTKAYKYKGSFLPWSGALSDEEVGEQKQAQVSNPKSEYYTRMPPAAAIILKQCWDEVRTYKYKQEPAYDVLRTKLAKLQVPTVAKKATKRAASGTEGPIRRSPRRSPPRAAAVANVHDESDDDGVVSMEIDEVWGHAEEENQEPAANETSPEAELKKDRRYYAAILEATSGPYKGTTWIVQEGEDENLFLGSNPSKRSYKGLVLANDPSVDQKHARVCLVKHKRMLKLLVHDNKSKSGTFVDSTRVSATGSFAAFGGNIIRVGDTAMKVKSCKPTA